MGLRDIRLPQEKIEVTDGESFLVRGLSLRDVGLLVGTHGGVMVALFNEYKGKFEKEGAEALDISSAGSMLFHSAPALATMAIALGADDLEAQDIIEKLPLPVQINALEKVLGLTFRTEQDLKNVAETVIRGLQGTTNALVLLKS